MRAIAKVRLPLFFFSFTRAPAILCLVLRPLPPVYITRDCPTQGTIRYPSVPPPCRRRDRQGIARRIYMLFVKSTSFCSSLPLLFCFYLFLLYVFQVSERVHCYCNAQSVYCFIIILSYSVSYTTLFRCFV